MKCNRSFPVIGRTWPYLEDGWQQRIWEVHSKADYNSDTGRSISQDHYRSNPEPLTKISSYIVQGTRGSWLCQ